MGRGFDLAPCAGAGLVIRRAKVLGLAVWLAAPTFPLLRAFDSATR